MTVGLWKSSQNNWINTETFKSTMFGSTLNCVSCVNLCCCKQARNQDFAGGRGASLQDNFFHTASTPQQPEANGRGG